MIHNRGLHHFHQRRRLYQRFEPYPHPNVWKRQLDRLIYVVAFVGPLMTIPQVLKIWMEKTAAGVSLLAWSTYAVTSVVWLLYGLAHKEKPILYSSIFWILLSGLIILGILQYG